MTMRFVLAVKPWVAVLCFMVSVVLVGTTPNVCLNRM